MKKTDWKIFIGAVVYTLLFYKQEAGLNFLIFSLLISVLSLLQDTAKLKQAAWLAAAFGTIFSGFFVFYYGTHLPIIANVISIIFLAGFTFKANTSLLLSGLNTLTSLLLALPFLVIDFFRNRNKTDDETTQKPNWFKKFLLLLFPLFVVFIFFVLYRDSNPLFLKITEKINLDWLSFPLVRHFLLALFLLYSFFVHSTIKRLNAFDEKTEDNIDFVDEEIHQKSFFARFISLESETYTAITLLLMLNVLIALLNGIDIFYLWLGADLPQGLVFSDYLHSGTFTLILSILLAIAIIVFFFRGIFNFNTKGKTLKILGFAWVVQNIVMTVSAMLRNKLYIEQYGMTHKRIGVYVFLTLAVIGLIMAFVKILAKKNIWFLFRKNAWAFYAFFVFSTAVNWDYIITKFNVQNANKNHIVDLDKNYLANLSHANTYILSHLESDSTPFDIYENYGSGLYAENALQYKIQKLLNYKKRNQWQEISVSKNKNVQELSKQNEQGKIAILNLSAKYLNHISVYPELSNIKGLDARENSFENKLSALAAYPKLEVLNLSLNHITSLDSFPLLPKLTHLNLSNNDIVDFKKLEQSTNLKALNISSENNKIDINSFPFLSNLETINLSQTKYESWYFLNKTPNLKEIIFEYAEPKNLKIPSINALEKVILRRSNLISNDGRFLESLAVCKNIKVLDLAHCNIQSTRYLAFHKTDIALFPNLEVLDIANNNLGNNTSLLEKYSQLKELNLSTNGIYEIAFLRNFSLLKSLDLSGNRINKLDDLKGLINLQNLNISGMNLENFEVLSSLKNLKALDISANYIRDISSILLLNKLEVLNIANNKIEDLSALKNLKNLKQLYIADNAVKDYTFLFEMKHLEYLSVGNLDLQTVELLKVNLPKTEIDYYSNNLDKSINYNNNKRANYSESF